MVCDGSSLVNLCKQDYKSLCAAVTVYYTLVNIQTDTQIAHDQLICKAQPAELKARSPGLHVTADSIGLAAANVAQLS